MKRVDMQDSRRRAMVGGTAAASLPVSMWGLLVLFLALLATPAWAQNTDSDDVAGFDPASAADGALQLPTRIRAGTRLVPPFVAHDAGDEPTHGLSSVELTGITMELWRFIETELGLVTTFREASIDGLLEGVVDGEFEIAVAALTVTAQRAEDVDFTHPYFTTGSAIAVAARGHPVWSAFQAFFSLRFLLVIAALAGLLALVGAVLWRFERGRNDEQFGGSAAQGLGSGFWWAAVTMTTVGYGDKAPTTLGGRIVALVWMFSALILISTFTAAIATTLTVNSLDTGIQNLADLEGQRVATVAGSSTESWLAERGYVVVPHPSLAVALDAVRDGEVRAVAHDAPLLRYAVRESHAGALDVLAFEFLRQDYAFALPRGSALRVPINLATLEFLESDDWERVQRRWLGNF